MGGEDWFDWMQCLSENGLLAPGVKTLAYSYIGPELTFPIYRDGTIGAAKKHLYKTVNQIDLYFTPLMVKLLFLSIKH